MPGVEAAGFVRDDLLPHMAGAWAMGDVATEDPAWQLERGGVETGVDVRALVGVADWREGVVRRQLPGYLHRSGRWP